MQKHNGIGGLPKCDRSIGSLFIEQAAIDGAKQLFKEFIGQPGYPCLGARAAVNSGACVVRCYRELGTDCHALAGDLYEFVTSPLFCENRFATFSAVFFEPSHATEVQFEQRLWFTLQQLHEIDATKFPWDASVSSDAAEPTFAFSFAGRPFYVVGLHPRSSRVSRCFSFPCLIFNAHEQFRRLRAAGDWEKMKAAVRKRDRALQGTVNPMLSDFGDRSEARQYSGRPVPDDWQAPFHPVAPSNPSRCPFGH